MSTAAIDRDAFMPRPPGGSGRGLAGSVIVHLLLVVALAFGVSWHASPPAGVQAELWSAVPQIAAPQAQEPPSPPPKPTPRVTTPKPAPAPTPAPRPEPRPDAQIAVERAKREDQRKQRELEEKREEERAKQQAQQREKQQALQREKQIAQREKEAADKKQAAEDQRKKKAEEARLAAQHEAQVKKILAQAGATGEPSSTGSAPRSAGPSAGYAGRILARVKPNIIYSDPSTGNVLTTVEVKLAPDGTIVGKRIVKRSGVQAWDDAVLRALDKTEVLPRDVDGRVFPVFEIDFRSRD